MHLDGFVSRNVTYFAVVGQCLCSCPSICVLFTGQCCHIKLYAFCYVGYSAWIARGPEVADITINLNFRIHSLTDTASHPKALNCEEHNCEKLSARFKSNCLSKQH